MNLTELKILKDTERQKVSIVQNFDGALYIKRELKGDKREIYKTLQKLTHPNIPKICSVDFNGDTTVIEEYINAVPLTTRKFTKKQIYSVAKQLLSALAALHSVNIIHRDVKPDNILIGSSGHIWLTDYDIARIYRNDVRRDTEAIGTFGYAPIEQFGMMPTDFKTDIYSFGVTLKSLLEAGNIKGSLYKTAQKCTRLDPAQRYRNIKAVRNSLYIHRFAPLIPVVAVILSLLIGYTANKYGDTIYLNTSGRELIRFIDFAPNETTRRYPYLENFVSTPIFSGEGVWHYLPIMADMDNSGTVLLGKGHSTPVDMDLSLHNGILSLSLKDEFGHSFKKDFFYDGTHKFNVLYPDNRRINAEIVCRDMDGDGVEELLVGICDCSLTTTDTAIYQYFNYSLGWVIRYEEARGFTLCEGDMFSENHKLIFVENDPNVHLPNAAANSDELAGYMLHKDSVIPFF